MPKASTAAARAKPPAHRWRFYRAGGVDQVRLDSGADIVSLDQLDQKLWVALSCPTFGLAIDPRTLAVLDGDGDGHIRPPEILAAVRWMRDVLADPDALLAGRDGLPLAEVRTDTAAGKSVRAAAAHILQTQGRQAAAITSADTRRAIDTLTEAVHNGDGVVPPERVEDSDARAIAAEIVDCFGGVADRSGKPGFDQGKLDAFFTACAAFEAWWRDGEEKGTEVLPLGADTVAAVAALEAVRAKVDDYFGRVRLAEFDSRALAALNRDPAAYADIAAGELGLDAREVIDFPLALVEPSRPLPLTLGVNPAWAAAIERLRAQCVAPLLGHGVEQLSEADWRALCAKLDGYRAWLGSKRGGEVEQLGIERIRTLLASDVKQRLQEEIDRDLAVKAEVDALSSVDKAVLLYRDLAELLNNYVNFSRFYSRQAAIFQAGTLHLDGRTTDLCVEVADAAKHAQLAAMAKTYLVYCTCKAKDGATLAIAAAITAGDSDNLFVGRNGVFYDRRGGDWDATVTKIVDNPISVRQAFWSPYKKAVRFIEEWAAKRAAAADADATAKLQAAVAHTGETVVQGSPPPKPKFDVGTIAALGVAVGGLTAALSTFLAAFFGLGAWIPLGIVGLMLGISGPSMLIAWLKLRQRNLGPILDANGWAVNALTRVNIPLGGALTQRAVLPPNSDRSLADPYAPRRRRWPWVLLLLAILAGAVYALYRFDYLHRWFPEHIPAHGGSGEPGQAGAGEAGAGEAGTGEAGAGAAGAGAAGEAGK